MSDKQEYTPISCEFYSLLEVAILHKEGMRVIWHDENEVTRIETLLLLDLKTEDHAEYLHARTQSGELIKIRLDKLHEVKKV